MNRNKKYRKGIKVRKTRAFKSLDWTPRNRLASTIRRMFGAEQQIKGK